MQDLKFSQRCYEDSRLVGYDVGVREVDTKAAQEPAISCFRVVHFSCTTLKIEA